MLSNSRLKLIRFKLNLSQKEICELLGMSQPAWSNCERGYRKLSLKRCYKLINLAKLKDISLSLEFLRPNE